MTDDEREHLHHSSMEHESLWEMLAAYWGKGDGAEPPAFIQRAAKLCGFPLQPSQ